MDDIANIGDLGIQKRQNIAYIVSVLTFIVSGLMVYLKANKLYRLSVFPLLYIVGICFFQAQHKC